MSEMDQDEAREIARLWHANREAQRTPCAAFMHFQSIHKASAKEATEAWRDITTDVAERKLKMLNHMHFGETIRISVPLGVYPDGYRGPASRLHRVGQMEV